MKTDEKNDKEKRKEVSYPALLFFLILTNTCSYEVLAAFSRFFDDSRTLDSMLQWVRDAIQVLPPYMGKLSGSIP